MAWWRRIVRLVVRRGREKEEDGKLPYYVDLWMRELIDEGIDPQAAREEAHRGFREVKGSDEPDDYPPICMKLSRLP
ncbi:MAG TPA: hypothetical protein VLX28_09615 [Thermoanaerobaculia bacterium]|nr:hypothetical protein [Thermoanaerobaculia bacterium]